LGFERLTLKNRKLRCYFVSNPQSPFFETDVFNNIVRYVAMNGESESLSFKKSVKYFILIREGVRNLRDAHEVLVRMQADVLQTVE
ncbi:MAG: hypothetical protein AAFV25_12800, partial [Bacteroidota bacterium]